MDKEKRYQYEFEFYAEYDTREQLRAMLEEVTTTESVVCKFCGSDDVVKAGILRNQQRHRCKKCGRTFFDNKSLPLMRATVRQLGNVLGEYYGGMSYKEIRRQFDQQHEVMPSRSTIQRWLSRYTKLAMDKLKDYPPIDTGKVWIADECVLKIGGENVWHYDVLDAKTRFLLASHLARKRTIKDAQTVMEKAYEKCGRIPDLIITDKQSSYIDGIERAFGADTKHIRIKGIDALMNTNLVERWHGTLRQRTKVMRGMKDMRTARLLLDGWLIHYNYFRPHESLSDRTPAEVAGVKSSYKDWLDIVESEMPSKGVLKGDSEVDKIVHQIRASPVRLVSTPRITGRKRKPRLPKSRARLLEQSQAAIIGVR